MAARLCDRRWNVQINSSIGHVRMQARRIDREIRIELKRKPRVILLSYHTENISKTFTFIFLFYFLSFFLLRCVLYSSRKVESSVVCCVCCVLRWILGIEEMPTSDGAQHKGAEWKSSGDVMINRNKCSVRLLDKLVESLSHFFSSRLRPSLAASIAHGWYFIKYNFY